MSGNITHGMNTTEVRQLATQLHNAAGEIRTLMQRLTTQLDNAPWVGADRTRFHSDWHGHHMGALNNVINSLEGASQAANTNASQQEQTSS